MLQREKTQYQGNMNECVWTLYFEIGTDFTSGYLWCTCWLACLCAVAVVWLCCTINRLIIFRCERGLHSVYLFINVMPYFFLQYLQTLHLQSCDLLDIFGGISFFPLDKMTYLKIQSFINRMEESLSIVKYTAFLYNDQLIWYVRPEWIWCWLW